MATEIINKVANSDLITIDLSDYVPKKIIEEIDLKDFLFEGLILKEKLFRAQLKEFDFSIFKSKTVAVFCSSNAIIPMWAYMLITSYLNEFSEVYFGNKEEVFSKVLLQNIENIQSSKFKDEKVIVKGCGSIKTSEEHYLAISKKLLPCVKSLMFGEACSSVPVFKKK